MSTWLSSFIVECKLKLYYPEMLCLFEALEIMMLMITK